MPIKARDARPGHPDTKRAQLLGEARFIGDDFNDSRKPRHRFRIARRIASHDHDRGSGIGLSQTADELTPLGIGFVGNGTGVYDA